MNSRLIEKCYEFIFDQRIFRETFGLFSYRQIDPVCACIMISSNVPYDEEKIRYCRDLIRTRNGVFSAFRSLGEPVITASLAADSNPDAKYSAAEKAYNALRMHFPSSSYLPVAAVFMTELCEMKDYGRRAEDAKYIFERMREKHFFLTGREDTLYALLIARTTDNYRRVLQEAEYIYESLKGKYLFRRNILQSMTHALVLCSGGPDEKIRRLKILKQEMEDNGLFIGSGYELVNLAILANLGVSHDQLLRDIIEADAFLSEQQEYGFLGFRERSRLMHTILILTAYYMTAGPELIAAVVVSVLIEIQQQQAAAASAAA